MFTSIKSAYQLVAAKLERDEEHFRYNVATFEVVLKKGIIQHHQSPVDALLKDGCLCDSKGRPARA